MRLRTWPGSICCAGARWQASGARPRRARLLLSALDRAELLDVASLAEVHSGLALLDLEEGRLEEALEHGERAAESAEARPSERVSLANCLFTLARVLRVSKRSPERAETLARRALEVLQGFDEDALPGRIRAWLAEGAPGAVPAIAAGGGAEAGDPAE